MEKGKILGMDYREKGEAKLKMVGEENGVG